jgi:hypothetical protein
MRVNSDFRAMAVAHFDPSQYLTSPSMGVNRFMLDRIGREKARATTIVEYQPHSKFPTHTHLGGEEFLVLQGTFCDQYGRFPAGTYVRNPIGSSHAPWVEADGCTILVKLMQMSDMGEPNKPIHITVDRCESIQIASWGAVQPLFQNKCTGETVEICWIDPNVEISLPSLDSSPVSSSEGGEELLVLQGSLLLKHDKQSSSSDETFAKWDWLRFPSHESADTTFISRPHLYAGPEGVQLYRKTHHLTSHALSMESTQLDESEHMQSQ